jgi:hypothetical protein
MLSALTSLPGVVLAGGTVVNLVPPAGSGFQNLNRITFSGIVQGLIGIVMVLAAIIFFFILVIGGIRWITSGGDKAQTEAARNQITAALIGLVIVFAAWAIIQLIQVFFAVNIIGGLNIIGGPAF